MKETSMEEIFEEFGVLKVSKVNDTYCLSRNNKKVIDEISLRIIVNDSEIASLLCMNQFQEELALGFLFNEGVINSYSDIERITYNEKMLAVIIQLEDGVVIDRAECLRSVTSGCGRCFTYINPLKRNRYNPIKNATVYSINTILDHMKDFLIQSELYQEVGGVHSALFYSAKQKIFIEDIGRHNCFDKITGVLLKKDNLEAVNDGILFVSGRVSSEIITKVIRTGIPILVSRSTPTAAAVKLAEQFGITLLGYARGDRCFIYSHPKRVAI